MPDENSSPQNTSYDSESASSSAHSTERSEPADINHRIESYSEQAPSNDSPRNSGWSAPAPEAQSASAAPHPQQPQQSQPQQSTESQLASPGPGMMVLQWLTYAFWGWTVLILSFLISLTVTQLLTKNDQGSSYFDWGAGIAYLLAAVIVLFVISLVTDIFYARAERAHARTTGTNVIMIIHAVIFALFGIGALISAVFGGVRLLLGEGGTSGSSVAVASIIAGLIVFALYGLTLLRTLRPLWIKNVASMYWLIMTIVIVISIVLGIVGPAAKTRLSNQDKQIETALPDVAQAINEQTTATGSLPTSLDKLTTVSNYSNQSDVQALIDSGKIDYTPGEQVGIAPTVMQLQKPGTTLDQLGGANPVIYHYQLCVVYQTSKGDRYNNLSKYGQNDQQYPTTLSTYDHPAGKKCYDLQTRYKSNY